LQIGKSGQFSPVFSIRINFQKTIYLFAASAFVLLLAGTTIAVFDETFALITEFEFASIIVPGFALAFASTLVFEFASTAGAASSVASEVVCKTEIFPVNAGIASNKAESINVVAATIVILDKIVCDPRG
jgi:hypothetical protein